MNNNRLQVLRDETKAYVASIKNSQSRPTPDEITDKILENVGDAIVARNASFMNNSDRKWKIPNTLEPMQVAIILSELYPVRKITCIDSAVDSDYDLLAIYQEDGPEKGIYSTSDTAFNNLCRSFHPSLSIRQLEEVRSHLSGMVPRVLRCSDRNLIPVNNGIFDYDTKQLLPFSPDMVFLTKCRVDYVPGAVSPVIHNPDDNTDWEIEDWIQELSDDEGVPELLWEIMGAAIRPNVAWNKSAWFYDERGNNGKGTLCKLMRNLCGSGNHASIKLDDFSKDFALEPLIRVSAIIVDENDVDVYIDRAANLKAVITNDTIQINRKFKQPIAYQFRGFMVQCINGMPRVRDKSDSFYRRQIFVPFRKCFTGRERKYIKDDYLGRKDVLEYALWRVLNMDYYQLSEPPACKEALAEYKEFNDPVRQFWNEHEDKFVWDLLPFAFLFDMYRKWLQRNAPKSAPVGRTTFTTQLVNIIHAGSRHWDAPVKNADGRYPQCRPGNMMDDSEPLIGEYGLTEWMDKSYQGFNTAVKYRPVLKPHYRGIQRKGASGAMKQLSGPCEAGPGSRMPEGNEPA